MDRLRRAAASEKNSHKLDHVGELNNVIAASLIIGLQSGRDARFTLRSGINPRLCTIICMK